MNEITVLEKTLNHLNSNEDENSLYILLDAPYGAGKTTFIQKLGKSIGITDSIKSPSYGYLNEYEISISKFTKLIHIDLWRDLDNRSLDLILKSLPKKKAIIAIEWANKLPAEFRSSIIKSIQINIEFDGENRSYKVV